VARGFQKVKTGFTAAGTAPDSHRIPILRTPLKGKFHQNNANIK